MRRLIWSVIVLALGGVIGAADGLASPQISVKQGETTIPSGTGSASWKGLNDAGNETAIIYVGGGK